MTIDGTEYCPYCNTPFEFSITEDVWVIPCTTCGRPTVLCDRCAEPGNCTACAHCVARDKQMKVWQTGEIGKAYWVDPSLYPTGAALDGGGSLYTVITFDKTDAYVLARSEDNKDQIRTFGEIIDYAKIPT